MTKFLLLAVVFAAVYHHFSRRKMQSAERPKSPESMVRCSRCGIHVPASESVTGGGRQFCSEAHRTLG